MLISALGFGSIWTRRVASSAQHPTRFGTSDTAYYNTTGVLVGDKLRNRPCVYGVARFNGNGSFRPDCLHQLMPRVFECEPPCMWNGYNKVLFKSPLARPEKPDAYLVILTAEQSGGINRNLAGGWLHRDAVLISLSECREQQEVMLVMPAYTWVRSRLGTFFIEPANQRPWQARLVLTAIA